MPWYCRGVVPLGAMVLHCLLPTAGYRACNPKENKTHENSPSVEHKAIYLTASSVLGDKAYYVCILLPYNFMCLCWLLICISSALQLFTRSAYIPELSGSYSLVPSVLMVPEVAI